MRNKFAYSCSTKIHALGFNKLLESIFCLLLVVEAFSLWKVVNMLKEVVVCWWEVRWVWQVRQTFAAQFIPLSKRWLGDLRSGVVVEDWTHSVDQRGKGVCSGGDYGVPGRCRKTCPISRLSNCLITFCDTLYCCFCDTIGSQTKKYTQL